MSEARRGTAEQKNKREADWKEAGEERSDERAGILSVNFSGTSDSEELLVLSAIYYTIRISIFMRLRATWFLGIILDMQKLPKSAISMHSCLISRSRFSQATDWATSTKVSPHRFQCAEDVSIVVFSIGSE